MANEYTQIANFPPLAMGDTFQEHTMTITVSANIDLTGAIYCMQMKENVNGMIIHDFGAVLQTLVSPQQAIVTIPSFNADYTPYVYEYGMRIILANGNKIYYAKGDFPIYSVIPKKCQ